MNRGIAVLVQTQSNEYNNYIRYIKPYLDHFGFPYEEVDGEKEIDCALILIGHGGVKLTDNMMNAIKNGVGLVSFSPDALDEEYLKKASVGAAKSITFANCNHYITQLHKENEEISLYGQLNIENESGLDDGENLITAEGLPLLQVGKIGCGKVVVWRDLTWISNKILGPVHGMDDIVWRSIVWAAKKPFVMQGMPPMLGMRVDDVWGAWRKDHPDNPLLWIDIANKYGFKPWLGLFQDNIDEVSTDKVRKLAHNEKVNVFPHAFAGCAWVGQDIEEHWAYFDHANKRPYSDEEMEENAERILQWYSEKNIPICKTAVGHHYEMGANAIKYILEMGCEFIGIHMKPSDPYGEGGELFCGPYRKYESCTSNVPKPVYYADYLDVEEMPEYSGKLFNCITEIRDVAGYEWYPNNNVEETVEKGVLQLRRAFDSMIPAFLFTHESCYIQQMNSTTWEESLKRITESVSSYEPEFMTMDDICGYVRAQHDISITDVVEENGSLQLKICGKNDRDTICFVFTENVQGLIEKKAVVVPEVTGERKIDISGLDW